MNQEEAAGAGPRAVVITLAGTRRGRPQRELIIRSRLGRWLFHPVPTSRRAGDPRTRIHLIAVRSFEGGGAAGIGMAVLYAAVFYYLAFTDHMTKVGNRRAFDVNIKDALRRARKSGGVASLVLLDVDRFKALNDSLGHQAGDEALRAAGTVLKREVKVRRRPLSRQPSVARYGGEEFVVVLPCVDAMDAAIFADRLRSALASAWLDSGTTASAGVAAFPLHGDSPEALMDRADKALYRSKQEGRNRTTIAWSCTHLLARRQPSERNRPSRRVARRCRSWVAKAASCPTSDSSAFEERKVKT